VTVAHSEVWLYYKPAAEGEFVFIKRIKTTRPVDDVAQAAQRENGGFWTGVGLSSPKEDR